MQLPASYKHHHRQKNTKKIVVPIYKARIEVLKQQASGHKLLFLYLKTTQNSILNSRWRISPNPHLFDDSLILQLSVNITNCQLRFRASEVNAIHKHPFQALSLSFSWQLLCILFWAVFVSEFLQNRAQVCILKSRHQERELGGCLWIAFTSEAPKRTSQNWWWSQTKLNKILVPGAHMVRHGIFLKVLSPWTSTAQKRPAGSSIHTTEIKKLFQKHFTHRPDVIHLLSGQQNLSGQLTTELLINWSTCMHIRHTYFIIDIAHPRFFWSSLTVSMISTLSINDKKLANSIPPFPQNHRISPIFTDHIQV